MNRKGLDAVVQGCTTQGVPTPIYHVRMPLEDRKNLVEMAKLYGSAGPAAFLREMVGAICSGDQNRVGEFLKRLLTKMGEQLTLDLMGKAAQDANKPALKVAGVKRKGKVRARRARGT